MRLRDRKKRQKIVGEIIERLTKMIEETPREYKKSMKSIGDKVIDEWYNDYGNRVENGYDPMGSLFNAYKIIESNENMYVDFSVDFMNDYRHHQSNEIIFNNAFIEGYHGGSMSKKNKKIKEPTWRTPAPNFPKWCKYPAFQSFSPYERMLEKMQKKEEQMQKKIDAEISGMIYSIKSFK